MRTSRNSPQHFRQGEYQTADLKAVKVSPPEKWADEKICEVHSFTSELRAFYALTALPEVLWAVVAAS